MHASAEGLLIFTETSTYLVTVSDDGEGFRAATVNPSVGCVSPDSIQTMPSGLVVWLGREGFYAWDGEQVAYVSGDIKDGPMSRINAAYWGRACSAVETSVGVYRCSIPTDGGNTNDLMLEFDGTGWREYDYIKAQAMCTTRDHRALILALGYVDVLDRSSGSEDADIAGLWVLDHAGRGEHEPQDNTGTIRTVWLSAGNTRRRTPMTIKVWAREVSNGELAVRIYRDWREYPVVETAMPIKKYAEDDGTSGFWGTTLLGDTYTNELTAGDEDAPIDVHWSGRRPYWAKTDCYVPACEVFMVEIEGTGDWEFVGLEILQKDSHAGGFKTPGGG